MKPFSVAAFFQALFSWNRSIPVKTGFVEQLNSIQHSVVPVVVESNTSTSIPCCNSTLPLRILTHNIRYATRSPFKGERPWRDRKHLIVAELLAQSRFMDGTSVLEGGASLICLQEVLHEQLLDVLAGLNGNTAGPPIWQHIGVGRDNGHQKGEYSPIIYPSRLLELLHFQNIWLSTTPDRPSKGWDASSRRVLTIGIFQHRQTGQRFLASNTHLDNAGTIARAKGAELILTTIEQARQNWRIDTVQALPYFLTGDFNSMPHQEAYQKLNGSSQVTDVYDHVPAIHRFGEEDTYTGFPHGREGKVKDAGRIDFIWLGPKDIVFEHLTTAPRQVQWNIEGYSVVPNKFDADIYSSDHRAVIADVMLSS